MQYRNTVTGAVIDIESELQGGCWERVTSPAAEAELKAPAQKKRKKAEKDDE